MFCPNSPQIDRVQILEKLDKLKDCHDNKKHYYHIGQIIKQFNKSTYTKTNSTYLLNLTSLSEEEIYQIKEYLDLVNISKDCVQSSSKDIKVQI